MIYFDHNSTTTLSQNAYIAMGEVMQKMPLNPSSVHSYGRSAKFILEQARRNILASLGATKEYNLLFTSSGTESNNLVLKNFYSDQILISAIEHLSIYEHVKYNQNINVIKVNEQGEVDLDHLESLLKNKNSTRCLVSIIYANNETGVLQDFASIIPLVKKYDAFIHSDFSQVVGKLECNLDDMNLDFITISSHKFGGPPGISALFYKKHLHLTPEMIGGGQEKGLRSGTENVVGAVGMAGALSDLNIDLAEKISYVKTLRDHLESKIKSFYPDVKIASYEASRLCNTSMIIMPNTLSQLQLIQFDLNGFAVSSGSACSSGKIGLSHVLSAMQYSREDADCAIRVSLNKSNTIEEVGSFCSLWEDIFLKHNTTKINTTKMAI
jgi:cysteine desulfurase